MIIGIDGNEANIHNRVGVGQFAFHIIQALNHLDPQNQYIVYLKNPPLPDLPPESPRWHYRVFGPKKLWTKVALPINLYLHTLKPDLFFSPSHYSPHFSPIPTIPTIHDLGYLNYPQQFTRKDLAQLTNWTKDSIFKASRLVCVSEFTKSEIQKIYHVDPSRISVVPNGVDQNLALPPLKSDQKTLQKFHIQKPYFLYLGTLKPSKNIPFLIKSYAIFTKTNPSHKLVIAGKKGWLFEDIFQVVKDHHLNDSIIFTDYLTEPEKWSLYRQATCTIIPSLYEGFGIPALESMKVGTPVISSSIPALKEVIGPSGLYIDPFQPQTLANALHQIIKPEVRNQQSKSGLSRVRLFTWQKSASILLGVFQNLPISSTPKSSPTPV
jgi:glycosyltransferase involved in cell wall biosynthesis